MSSGPSVIRACRERAVGWKQSWSYWTSKPHRRHAIENRLTFGEEANQRFAEAVGEADVYLEFGSGASTLVASSLGPTVVSVESDPAFLSAVQRSISAQHTSVASDVNLIHGDIGRTGPWGKPIFPSFPRPGRWLNYPLAPWAYLGSEFSADVVLVDGRFRVACALAVALYQDGDDWLLLVDDYVARPEYRILESYMSLVKRFGRMAEFRPRRTVDRLVLERALRAHISDWR